MDNLSSHKEPRVRELMEAAGASHRYLLPYSPPRATQAFVAGRGSWLAVPDLNPIENAFAKLKALPRKTAARTIGVLWAAIGSFVDAFTPAECVSYSKAEGLIQTERKSL